ncbi:MAG: hypothetical protein AB7G39_10040 [Alphaproteobacteria bacterium]
MPSALTRLARRIDALPPALRWGAAGLVLLGYVLWWMAGPQYNWDVLPYVGCLLAADGADPSAMHAQAYDLVRAATTPAQFHDLTDPSWPYRDTLHRDPEAFRQQLPFYCSKPAYIAAAQLARALGADPVAATHLVSAVGAGLAILILAFWLSRRLSFSAAIAVAAAAALCGLHKTAGYSSPDGLSAPFVVGAFALAAANRPADAMIVLAASIPVRPDNAVLFALLTGYLVLLAPAGTRLPPGRAVATTLAGAGVFLAMRAVVETYPHSLHLFHSFVSSLPYPASEPARITVADYLAALPHLTWEALRHPQVGLLLCLGAALPGVARRLGPDAMLHAGLAATAAAYMVLRFVLFPEYHVRFFAAHFAVIVAAAAVVGQAWLARSGADAG